MPVEKYLQETGGGEYQLEDTSGNLLLESSDTYTAGYRSLFAVFLGGAAAAVEAVGPPKGSLALLGVGA